MRTGIGHDIHRLVPTIKTSAIPIGGIEIPCFFSTNTIGVQSAVITVKTEPVSFVIKPSVSWTLWTLSRRLALKLATLTE